MKKSMFTDVRKLKNELNNFLEIDNDFCKYDYDLLYHSKILSKRL